MTAAVKIVLVAQIDEYIVEEISEIRQLKLNYYRNLMKIPQKSLEILKNAGIDNLESKEQLLNYAAENITEMEKRILEPLTLYDDELSQYKDVLDINK